MSAADNLRAEQKAASKKVGAASKEERPALLEQAKVLAEKVKAAEAEQADAEKAFTAAHMAISNVIIDGVPAGGEDDFVVLDTVGEPPAIDDPKDHVELGESLGLFDLERGAKVSGARFYFLTGYGALLQLGLMQLAVRLATENGFTLVIPPVLVRPEIMEGTGFLGAHSEEVYRLEADDLYLVGTSEVPLAGYHSDEILDLSAGPLRYAGWSSCFRREAGSHGKDTRGIIRVHQFDKVEGFVYCRPEEAEAEHDRLLGWERQMLANIDVPYRVIDIAAGDLGCIRGAQVRLRGLDTDPADLPGADVDVELHDVSGPSARDSLPRRERQTADGGDAERDAGDHPLVGRDPGEPPAARRQRAGARGVGALCRHRSAGAALAGPSSSSSLARNSLGRCGVNAGLGRVPATSSVTSVDLIGRHTSSGSQRRRSELPQMRNRWVNIPSGSAL